MAKTISMKQLAANRANARKSTGPRTAAGRAIAKMNALKHGILSREVLVQTSHRRESAREFTALHQRFWEDWNPVGPTEEMLLDQIVTTHWRLRRALTAEAGEIALSVGTGSGAGERGPHPRLLWMEWEVFGDPIWEMEKCDTGLGLLVRWLGEVRAAVEREGQLSEAVVQGLVRSFHDQPNVLTRELDALRLKLLENPEGLDAGALAARNRQEALTFLDRKVRLLGWRREQMEQRAAGRAKAQRAAAVLPALPVLDKIMRYETKLERQLYRAMAQLERLQRLRRGEAVPAPLTVEVSERE